MHSEDKMMTRLLLLLLRHQLILIHPMHDTVKMSNESMQVIKAIEMRLLIMLMKPYAAIKKKKEREVAE
jgi:hypothetical protein